MKNIVEQVARAWASIDGKAEAFDLCKKSPGIEETHGHYEGYTAEARELLNRSGLSDLIERQSKIIDEMSRALAESSFIHTDKIDLHAAWLEWRGDVLKRAVRAQSPTQ